MVGRGPPGAGALALSLLVILTAEGCGAQNGDGCGPSVLGPSSGTLSSRGYPGTYPNDSVCEWEISVPPKKRIHFRFALLDIEDNNCQVNYLRLYNGIGSKRSEIEKYCGLGLKVEKLIETSDHEATVQFRSGTHHTGRGFYLSYSTTDHTDLITCLDKGTDFSEAEFSKYCPAGCSTSAEEVSGTIPKGYRETSPLCTAAIHAGVVSNAVGGRITVVSSKGIPHYEGALANNVSSTGGSLSNSLFTFRTNGCYGTLGLESGVVANSQLAASSSLNSYITGQDGEWGPSGARLKQAGLPWAPSLSDDQQWLQVDLRRETRITGIITTGSTLREYPWFVSEYRVLFSNDGRDWSTYTEANSTQPKSFQGNVNYLHEVRNNFIPPIEARFVRINPVSRHPSRVALKLELLGCRLPAGRTRTPVGPRTFMPSSYPPRRTKRPPQTTPPPDIRNTTMPSQNDVSSAAVLVSVLVVVPTVLIVVAVCAWHCKNKKKNSEGTYDLPQWDSTDWWKSMKQLLPSKMLETEENSRYTDDGDLLTGRVAVPRVHAEPAEYAQPLVSGVTTLGARSTFKPDEGPELYDAPVSDAFHAYAEPLPATGSEYATPIVVDMGCHPSSKACGFMGPSSLHARTDSERSEYDTPKNSTGQATPTEELTYQVPQVSAQKAAGEAC
ncbi:hypothetical protein OJAV_G00207660 [Oryzias javanicus]|uniref:Discoidin, CUB and LCCL domain-containing protein 2 n=1 Tax=Oryzias javanicus TaxID=123683 RepID=A0A3S2NSJ8_ORYJA|nr:hypothetical protein OJAV_G00207660 [Oryzias javanicus]